MRDAVRPGDRKLQMARIWLTTGTPTVMMFVPEKFPFKVMMSPTVLGEAVIVPPTKEVFGALVEGRIVRHGPVDLACIGSDRAIQRPNSRYWSAHGGARPQGALCRCRGQGTRATNRYSGE